MNKEPSKGNSTPVNQEEIHHPVWVTQYPVPENRHLHHLVSRSSVLTRVCLSCYLELLQLHEFTNLQMWKFIRYKKVPMKLGMMWTIFPDIKYQTRTQPVFALSFHRSNSGNLIAYPSPCCDMLSRTAKLYVNFNFSVFCYILSNKSGGFALCANLKFYMHLLEVDTFYQVNIQQKYTYF